VERRACSEQRAAGEDASGRNERMRRGRAAFYRGRKGRSKDRPRAADPLVLSSACPARSADRCDPPRPQPISALGGAPRQGPDGSKLARRARGWLSPHCAPQRCHPGARPGPGLEHGCDVHGGPQLACGCLGRRRNGELSGGWTGLGPSLVLYEKCAVCGQAHRVAQRLPFCEYPVVRRKVATQPGQGGGSARVDQPEDSNPWIHVLKHESFGVLNST
jgi:hypothetical protein